MAGAVWAVPAILVGVLIFAIGPGPWWLGILVGAAAVAGALWWLLQSADRRILTSLGGGLLRADGSERLENLVQGLSLAGGVEEPTVTVLADPARNALVLRNRGRNHLVMTQGLLESLSVVELEGVAAELLVRLKNGDAEAATTAAALFGRPMIDGPLGSVLRPIGGIGMGRLLDDDRDLDADRQAVDITRYPPGLLSAYRVMSEGEMRPNSATEGIGHLWLVDPAAGQSVDGRRAPLDLRINVLAEL
jgi:heat shock protein HtpX